MKKIRVMQDMILAQIVMEKAQKWSAKRLNSVWFNPVKGVYLQDDEVIPTNVVEPMVADGRLQYLGVEKFRGVLMNRYSIL